MTYYKRPTAVVESDRIGDGTKIWHFLEPKDADLVFDSFRLTLERNENVEVIGNNE